MEIMERNKIILPICAKLLGSDLMKYITNNLVNNKNLPPREQNSWQTLQNSISHTNEALLGLYRCEEQCVL